MWRIAVVGRSIEMIACQITDVISSHKDAVHILEKLEVTEGWEKVGFDLNQGIWWLTQEEWHSENWFELVFRDAIDWDDQSVRDFKQIAAGGEWRDTLSPLFCLPRIFFLCRLLVIPWPEAWSLSTEWRNNLICHGQVCWRFTGTISALAKVLCHPVLNPAKLIQGQPLVLKSWSKEISQRGESASLHSSFLAEYWTATKAKLRRCQWTSSSDSLHNISISRNYSQ